MYLLCLQQKKITYMKLLGSYHTEENVRTRLEKNRCKTKVPKHLSKEARLYINISTYVTTGNWKGFERWAKLNNLLNYEDFQQPISDMENSVKAADQRIEKPESKQAATVREKQELLKKQKTLNIFRQNFTVLLSEQSSQIYPSQRDNVHL